VRSSIEQRIASSDSPLRSFTIWRIIVCSLAPLRKVIPDQPRNRCGSFGVRP
jgi:hypothetical protein